MKKCRKCCLEKDEHEFHSIKNKKNITVLAATCKKCKNFYLREKYKEQKKYHIERNKKWADLNPEKVAASKNKYYLKNKKKFRESSEKWRKNNKEKHVKNVMACNKQKNITDPIFKLSRCIRRNVYRIIYAIKKNKQYSSLTYLGCSLEEFKIHIESQWKDGMSWDNYSINGWHIDHIIPLSYFIKNTDDPWKANHYTNLQPLWSHENLKKSSN